MKIFVVDDDPTARMIAVDQLNQPSYEVRELDSGEALLAAMQDTPDLILLDIEMAGMDGIAACYSLRQAGEEHAQVIFVSFCDDIETRLAAYDAGGNDFIVKPYDAEELAQKARVAEGLLIRRTVLVDQAQYARNAAFTAMSSMAEMAVLQDFLRASFNCQTQGELSRAICNAMEQYGLQGLVELRDEGRSCCHSSRGACTALEVSLLGHARGLERIFQFSDRLVINYPHTTLFISNLPLRNPDQIGRLRDHLAVLAEGAEARFIAMGNESRRLAQAHEVVAAVADLTATLEEIEKNQEEQRVQSLTIANEQMVSLTKAFVYLGLSEGQEETLVALTQDGINRISQSQNHGLLINRRLHDVTSRLRKVTVGKG